MPENLIFFHKEREAIHFKIAWLFQMKIKILIDESFIVDFQTKA